MLLEAVAIFLPALSAISSLFLEKKLYARLSTIATGISFLLSLLILLLGRGSADIPLLRFDGLGSLLASYILLVSFVIHKYSENYMKDEQGYKRYFFLLDLMTLNLLLLVLADHMLLLFACWHLMGVLLYMLLTFNHRRLEAFEYGNFALFTHRFADVPLLVAILMLYKAYGTFSVSELIKATLAEPKGELWVVSLLVMVSGLLKSAQIPFHLWLVYSMEGPTPVSALMHAGIVNAGAFLANRFAFLFPYDQYGLNLAFMVGIITAILGSMLMLMQNDIKKALGYSTVGQMGYMMMEIGVGAFALAVYHMMAHGIFKATLFLSSGSVIHEARKDTNIPRDEVYDALVRKEVSQREMPVVLYGVLTLLVPLLLVVGTHAVFEYEILRYKTQLVLLFFGWATSAQILINLFRLGRERPLLTSVLGVLSLFVLLSVYVLAGESLKNLIMPYAGLQERIMEVASSNTAFILGGILLSLLLVMVGWVLVYFASKDKPVEVHLSLYAHLSRELYFPDIYRLVGRFFKRLSYLTSFGTVPLYLFYYDGGSFRGVSFDVLLLALFVPLFPLSLITSYFVRRFWIYSLPALVGIAFVLLWNLPLPSDRVLYSLAVLTLLFHSLRAFQSQSMGELLGELYPALLSLVWLSGKEHFLLIVPALLLLFLSGLYLKASLGTASFTYAGGLLEKMPLFSFLFVIVSLYACMSPPMPTFYSLWEALLKTDISLGALLLAGWFLLGSALVVSACRVLYGKPREDLYYPNF